MIARIGSLSAYTCQMAILPVFYYGAPGGRSLPEVLSRQFSVFRKRSLRRTENRHRVAVGEYFRVGDGVIGNDFEIADPGSAKFFCALNAVAQRIDEFSIRSHQRADALGIARINKPLELQHNFYGIGHGCPMYQ